MFDNLVTPVFFKNWSLLSHATMSRFHWANKSIHPFLVLSFIANYLIVAVTFMTFLCLPRQGSPKLRVLFFFFKKGAKSSLGRWASGTYESSKTVEKLYLCKCMFGGENTMVVSVSQNRASDLINLLLSHCSIATLNRIGVKSKITASCLGFNIRKSYPLVESIQSFLFFTAYWRDLSFRTFLRGETYPFR